MLINPNLYKGDRKIVVKPLERIGASYISDTSNLIPGETYTFSCKMKQIPGEGKQVTNETQMAQGHSERYKSYGGYSRVKIVDGILEYTFKYISDANAILCHTAVGQDGVNMGAEWSDIEIVEGGTKNPIFVPSENNIETAKRQYFIGGDTSRKYILSNGNIEQSSFRKEVAA